MRNGDEPTPQAGPGAARTPAFLLPAPSLDWPPPARALTSLVGRETEIAELSARLRTPATRLLTLTGPGGIGKTRLAQTTAVELRPAFENRVGFVPLAPVRDPSLVLATIARHLGVPEDDRTTLPRRLWQLIGDQRAMLVLDNFERVVRAAPAIAELLLSCPRLTVMVTSRTRLRVSGELVYPVPPLAVRASDGADGAAVRLFVERASAVQPKLSLTAEARATISAICDRLDGLPLAIELAAAWTGALPPEAILARLAERLPLLVGGPREQPARLQTMERAIAWSYGLLRPEEQRLFRRLSVLAGSFDLAAGVALSTMAEPSLLPTLAALIDQSLLQVESATPEPRYMMLETIREFGLKRLSLAGEADETCQRHAEFFRLRAERIEPELCSPDEGSWLDQLERDRPNLRAALARYIEMEAATPALRLAAALLRYWEIRGYLTEGREWLRGALAISGEVAPTVRANALWRLSHLDLYLGDYAEARHHAAQSLALAESVNDPAGIASGHWALGLVARFGDDLEAAQPHFAHALELYRDLGNDLGVGKCLANLAKIAHAHGDLARARSLHEEALASRRALGSPRELAYQYLAMADLALSEQRLPDARAQLGRALALFEELGEDLGYMLGLGLLAQIEIRTGRTDEAFGPLAQMLALYRKLQVREGLVTGLEATAAAVVASDATLAARIIGVVEADRARTGFARTPRAELAWQRTVTACHGALGDAEFSRQGRAGAMVTLFDMVDGAEPALRKLQDRRAATHHDAPMAEERRGAPGSLTARELDVLRLLATGQTNPQIADALFIATDTAKTHVSSILAKLGVGSRTAAAVVARERNLI